MYGHYTTAAVIMEYMMPPYTTTWSSPKTTPRFQIITWNNIQPPKIPKLRSIPQPTNPTHRALHQHESLFATHKISSANQLGNWFPSALMSLFSCAHPKQVSSWHRGLPAIYVQTWRKILCQILLFRARKAQLSELAIEGVQSVQKRWIR